MKICFLSSEHPPQDKRVFDKEAVSLAAAGFEVVHLAPGDGREWVERGVRIVTYTKRRGLVARVLQLPRLLRRARAIDADVYHCNEVDSWGAGVVLRLVWGKKCVFDVHEHYPSRFAESRFPEALHPAVAALVRGVFRLFAHSTDRLVYAKRSVAGDFSRTGVPAVLVQNFAQRGVADAASLKAAPTQDDDRLRLIHLGLISKLRGWPQLLEAMAMPQASRTELLVVGEFNDGSLEEFRARAQELDLSERVKIEEWMPFAQAYERICRSHVGLVLFQPGIQNHVFAMPHKMFDYMMAGLPIVVPEFAQEVAPIVQESECGFLVDSSSPLAIAQALAALADDPQLRRRMGERGRQAVFERYNWEAEAGKLVSMYRELEAAA